MKSGISVCAVILFELSFYSCL